MKDAHTQNFMTHPILRADPLQTSEKICIIRVFFVFPARAFWARGERKGGKNSPLCAEGTVFLMTARTCLSTPDSQ